MSFRGYDPYLVSRATRADGSFHYLEEDTIRWHDSYCGTTGVLAHGFDEEPRRLFTIVESSRNRFDPEARREYRAVAFLFTDQGPAAKERVENIYVCGFMPNARHAEAAMRRYLANVASKIQGGMSLDDAARESVEASA